MEINFATLDTCETAEEVAVVIDVVRAFTTAAYALAARARDILLVSTVEEALALRAANPGARVMGEVGGFAPPGFDFGNSPRELLAADVAGRRLIQRTSAGTQGVVRSRNARLLLAASFVCASATVRYIEQQQLNRVTFVVTGIHDALDGDEDWACAEYLSALLQGQKPHAASFLDRVHAAIARRMHPDPELHAVLAADAPYCTALDRFPFAMRVHRVGHQHVMLPVIPCDTTRRP